MPPSQDAVPYGIKGMAAADHQAPVRRIASVQTGVSVAALPDRFLIRCLTGSKVYY